MGRPAVGALGPALRPRPAPAVSSSQFEGARAGRDGFCGVRAQRNDDACLINLSRPPSLDKLIIVRTPLDSPFSPGSDTVPQVWAGRTPQLSDWRDVLRPRRIAGIPERGRTILGEAGTGKSSLVRRIATQAAAQGDWVTPQLRIPSGSDPIKRVASALLDLAGTAGLATRRERRIAELLNRVQTVAASGVSLSLRPGEGPEPYMALTDLLVEIGLAAERRGDVMVLVHIDEAQNIHDSNALSQLLIALGDSLTFEHEARAPGGLSVSRGLPIAVYLTGLPEFAEIAGAREGATFARRFQTSILGAIDDDALMTALQPLVTQGWETPSDHGAQRVFMEPAAQRRIVALACGEPFLFQLAGERAWYAGTGDVITEEEVTRGWRDAAQEAEAHVLRILDRLPAREREFVEAMAALEPEDRTLTNISRQLGHKAVTAAGPTSQRLDVVRGIIQRGKPYRFQHRAVEAYLTSDWPRMAQ